MDSKTTEYIWYGDKVQYEEVTHNTDKSKHINLWGATGLAARNDEVFSSDAHGNTDEKYSGTAVKRYVYDAYGNEISESGEDDNPYRYCGENYDEETGLYYLRARYYDPSIGRFMSEDPAQDGLNWYVYCGGNPVMCIDPFGLDYLVVSGSEYDDGRWKYNFIEPAIKKIKELKELDDDEWIDWIVSATGYSDEALKTMNDLAAELGVGFVKIYSAAELQNYINSADTGTWELSEYRENNPVRKFVVFSHGLIGSVALGYHQWNEKSLNLGYNWIQGLCWQAFDNPNSMFYSCNTGTDVNGWGTNFAQYWINLVGGQHGQLKKERIIQIL